MRKAPPIPSFLLCQTVHVKTCTGIDAWQNPAFRTQAVQNVCVQPSEKIVMGKDNSQLRCSTVVFVDARRSTAIDMDAEKCESEANGHPAVIAFGGIDHMLISLDTVYNPDGSVHHWEMGLA